MACSSSFAPLDLEAADEVKINEAGTCIVETDSAGRRRRRRCRVGGTRRLCICICIEHEGGPVLGAVVHVA